MYYGPAGAMYACTCPQEQVQHCRASFMEHDDYKKPLDLTLSQFSAVSIFKEAGPLTGPKREAAQPAN